MQPYRPSPLLVLEGAVARDALTQGEYEAFKALLPSWRDRLIAMVQRNTGLRINELLALEVRHCNLAGPTFYFYTRRSKKQGPAEYDSLYLNPGLTQGMVDLNGNNSASLSIVYTR